MLQDVFNEVFDENASTYSFIIFTYSRFTLHLTLTPQAEKRNFQLEYPVYLKNSTSSSS